MSATQLEGASLTGARRVAIAAAAVLGGVLTLAGCSASSGSAPSRAPSTVSTTVTATSAPPTTAPASTSASAAPSSSVSGSPTAGVPCANGQVAVSVSEPNGASGHNGYPIHFRNVSTTACTLHGYPGFDAFQDAKPPIHAKRTLAGYFGGSRHGLPTVRLAPGHVASALVEYSTVLTGNSAQGCPSTSRVAITVPNTTHAVLLHAPATLCSLQIHPTVPGTSGDGD